MKFLPGEPPKPKPAAPQERPGRIDYLYVTAEQSVAVQAMNDAIDELPPLVRLRCQTPEVKTTGGKETIHYPHVDYDERTPPTPDEADLMCRTSGEMCPLAKHCLTLGKTLQAPVGVWGGRVLVDGNELRTKKGNK